MKQTLSFLFLLIAFSMTAQEVEKEKELQSKGFLVNASYGFNLPLADMGVDYGIHSDISFNIEYFYEGYIFGLESNFIFGNTVKNDVLAKIRTENGGIPNSFGQVSVVTMGQRGMYLGGIVGKIVPLGLKATRSGIRLTLGTGFLQHKINIVDDSEAITQLQGEYKKGYDHLTNGWAIKQFVGYHHLSNNGRLNFFAGIESTQGFTKNRRDFNFDTLMKDDSNRVDAYVGFRLGWTISLYQSYGEDVYYY